MTDRFVVRTAADADYRDAGALAPDSHGFTRWCAVGFDDGAAHTDFGVSRLEVGGSIPTHVHSFEESFHLVEGEVLLVTPEATVHLVAGDYGVIPLGVPHSWQSIGDAAAVWSDIYSPPPRPQHGYDTYRVPDIATTPWAPH